MGLLIQTDIRGVRFIQLWPYVCTVLYDGIEITVVSFPGSFWVVTRFCLIKWFPFSFFFSFCSRANPAPIVEGRIIVLS